MIERTAMQSEGANVLSNSRVRRTRWRRAREQLLTVPRQEWLSVLRAERARLSRALRCGMILSATIACSGPDHLTDPVVSEGGAYFQQFGSGATTSSATPPSGGTGNNSAARGGNGSSNSSGTGANTNSFGGQSSNSTGNASFDWGSSNYDANGGNSVPYQGHYAGMACLASCHSHGFTLGGTVYLPGGTATAGNAQIGILANGKLTTTYSGKQGNFFLSIAGNVDWSTAQIAIRTSNGTTTMVVNGQTNGNCNTCHDASRRLVVR